MKTIPQRGYFRPIVLILLGFIGLGLTLTMDYFFGRSLALDDMMKVIMGVTFVGIELIVVGLAYVGGSLFREGSNKLATSLSVFIVLGASLAMTATIGFGHSQRLGKAEAAVAAFEKEKSFAEQKNADARDMRNRTADWARNTAVTGGTRSIRQQASETLQKLAMTPLEMTPVETKMVSPDLQAEALVQALQTVHVQATIDKVQLALAIGVAVFLTLSQSICFGLASYLWPVKVAATKPLELVAESFREELEEPVKPRSLGNDHRLSDDDLALAAALKPDVEELQKMRSTVSRFLEECTYQDEDSRVKSADVYDAYVAWAQRSHEEEKFSHNMFGRICTQLGVARDNVDRRRGWYVGLGLLDGDEEVALARAA